jgi:hypothetical protein
MLNSSTELPSHKTAVGTPPNGVLRLLALAGA